MVLHSPRWGPYLLIVSFTNVVVIHDEGTTFFAQQFKLAKLDALSGAAASEVETSWF
jgi:hypothetical protein